MSVPTEFDVYVSEEWLDRFWKGDLPGTILEVLPESTTDNQGTEDEVDQTESG